MSKATLKIKSFVVTEASKNVMSVIAQKDDTYDLTPFHAKDPSQTQWRSQGLVPVMDDEYIYTVDHNNVYVMAVQFNERMLPAKVRDEHLSKLVADFKSKSDYPMSKKDFAMLREQAEFDLLPKAFIKRTVVPVVFIKRHRLNGLEVRNFTLICTSSWRRAEEAVAVLSGTFNNFTDDVSFKSVMPQQAARSYFNGLVDSTISDYLHPGVNAVLKRTGAETIRVKGNESISAQADAIVKKQGYDVTELGIDFYDGMSEEATMRFTYNDKYIFKGIKIAGTVDIKESSKSEDEQAAFMSSLYINAKVFKSMLEALFDEMGGVTLQMQQEEADAEEDEEL